MRHIPDTFWLALGLAWAAVWLRYTVAPALEHIWRGVTGRTKEPPVSTGW